MRKICIFVKYVTHMYMYENGKLENKEKLYLANIFFFLNKIVIPMNATTIWRYSQLISGYDNVLYWVWHVIRQQQEVGCK